MAARIQLRRDTAANWTTTNPVLADGEVGLEKDTGKEKVGDGATAWASLGYRTAAASEIHSATSKTTPVDADELGVADSAASFGLKKLTWANLKATIKAYIEGVTLNTVTTAAGTVAAPALRINSTNTGWYDAGTSTAFSVGGLAHNYITDSGQVNFPGINTWNLGTLTSIESHVQNTANTVAAAGSTYGFLLNYVTAPANLIGSYTNHTSQFTFNGPAGTITNIAGVISIPILGASNLSDITNVICYNTNMIVTAGTIANSEGYRANATIGTTATNSYGFKGIIAAGTGKWNLYMNGTAANYLAGNLLIGSVTDDGVNKLQVAGGAYFSGNILRGLAAPVTVNTVAVSAQTWGTNSTAAASQVVGISGANTAGPSLYLTKTRGTAPSDVGALSAGDSLGGVYWMGNDGVDNDNTAAKIISIAESNYSSNNCKSYLALFTNPGTQPATEKLRITGEGAQLFFQPAPAAKTTVVTLTAAELLGGMITGTPSAGDTAYTLPLGTDTETAIGLSPYDNESFDWTLINLATGTNTITLTANTNHTIVGNPLLAISASSTWRTRRTAANTYVTYRIA